MYASLLLLIAYLLGSFPSALIIGKKAKGIDIREYGSKNLGTTNAIRVLGKKLGLTVFILDVLKGAIAVGGARILYEVCGYQFTEMADFFNFGQLTVFPPLYYGLMAVIGHMYPVFANFKGGKAVATSLGITLVIAPVPALLCLLVFWITLKISGYVSLSSTFAILTVCISSFIQHFVPFFSNIFGHLSIEILVFFSAISLFMIFKHRKNYIRILNGTENSFKKKKVEKLNDANITIENDVKDNQEA